MYFVNTNNNALPPKTFSIPPQINICMVKRLEEGLVLYLKHTHIDDYCILLNVFKTQKVNMARPCKCIMGMELT